MGPLLCASKGGAWAFLALQYKNVSAFVDALCLLTLALFIIARKLHGTAAPGR